MSQINTICRDCVFAKYLDNKQYGCELGRIERFASNGGSPYLTNNKGLDKSVTMDENDDRTFYHISRFCTTARNSEWAEKISQDKWIETVTEEVKLKHTIVGIVAKGVGLQHIEAFIESCLKQLLKPTQVIIVNADGIATYFHISNMLSTLDGTGITYKNILALEATEYSHCVDTLRNQVVGSYFSVFQIPHTVPETFTKDLNVALNERLDRFVMLEGEQGFTIQTKLFDNLDGNKPKVLDEDLPEFRTIQDKVKYLTNDDNKYLIKKLEEVVVL